jgi:two-component system, sensor histidine kinase RegB
MTPVANPAPSESSVVHIAALGDLIRRFPDRSVEPGGGAPGRVLLHTLMMTRWLAVFGQLFAILFVHFSLDIALPLAALLPAVALSGVVNLVLAVRYKATTRLPERSALLLFAYDLCQLAYLLALTGGIQNPFVTLVLVPVALSAATLSLRATAAVSLLGLIGLAGLALWPAGLPWRDDVLVLPSLYRVALWSGLCLATLLLATFVWSIAEEARRRAEALSATQLALAREQEMSALGGQAAAVAHLLGTPLGTINIIAKELVRELPDGSPLAEDAAELLAQAQRCRELLRGLGRTERRDGDHAPFTGMPFSAHLEAIAAELERPGVEVVVQAEREKEGAEPSLVLRPEVRHSLANLVDNAVRFARSLVTLSLVDTRSGLSLTIEDDGPGFPPEALDWLGEPFLATGREEGGLGLGIFIANTLLARTGATVQFSNTSEGARVVIFWPRAALERGQLGIGG